MGVASEYDWEGREQTGLGGFDWPSQKTQSYSELPIVAAQDSLIWIFLSDLAQSSYLLMSGLYEFG